MTKEEKTINKITLLLCSLPDEETIRYVSNQACDMATRAKRGWWELVGRPHFNKQMTKIKRKLDQKEKTS